MINSLSATQFDSGTRITFFRSMRGQLILWFLAVSLIPLAIVGSVAITQLYAAKSAANEVSDNYFPSIINLDNAELALMQIIKAQKNHIIAPDDATMRAFETTIKTEREKLFNALAAFEVTLDEGTETQAFERFQIVLNAFLQDNAQVILLSQSNTDDEAQALSVGKASDKFEEAFSLMETMRETNIVGSEQAKIAANQATRTGVILTLVTSLMITIIVIIAAVWVANSIANPIMIVTKAVRNLAIGNVKSTGIDSVEVEKILTRRDEMGEIGRAFDNLVIYFQSVIADIVQVSQGLAEGNLHIMPQTEYRGDFVHIKNALETALSNQRLVIEDIVKVSQGLAEGNLSITPQSEYQGDFIQIKNAQESALSNQRQVIEDIVQVSQGLANGHLNMTSKAIYQGDFAQIKTALETALSNLRQVIEDIVRVSQGLAEGTQNVTSQAEYQGDFVQIKIALTSATTKLAETSAKNATQDWLKTGQTQLNEKISGEQAIDTLAKNVISFLTTYIKAQVGLFYLLKEPKSLHQKPYLQVIAGYAYTFSDNIPTEFCLGDGLVGQAALEKQAISHVHLPEEYTHIIQSGMAKSIPRYVLMLPFLYENTVKGVIEIGSTQALTDIQQNFLEQVIPSIGIALNTAESRAKMQALLAQSQRQTEELQTQSEELQAQQEEMQQVNEELQHQREELEHKQGELQQRNEELQSQSEELKTQSEELQTQQEELRHSNNELEERTQALKRQKDEVQAKNIALEKTQAEMARARAAIEEKAQELELASKYKSEFLANMSHELRTPLNSLLILSQLLADNKTNNLTDKQVEYVRTIHSSGSDLLTLINEILDLSKVEAGKIEIRSEEVLLTNLVAMVKQKFQHLATEKGLAFQVQIAQDVPTVLHTDEQRLKQIINNLLSNAFKFTIQGEVRLDIESFASHPFEGKDVPSPSGRLARGPSKIHYHQRYRYWYRHSQR